jgi:hypothetical protein
MEGNNKCISWFWLLRGLHLRSRGRGCRVGRRFVLDDVVLGFQVEEPLAHVPGNIGLIAVEA